jgi:hypothetical protein
MLTTNEKQDQLGMRSFRERIWGSYVPYVQILNATEVS